MYGRKGTTAETTRGNLIFIFKFSFHLFGLTPKFTYSLVPAIQEDLAKLDKIIAKNTMLLEKMRGTTPAAAVDGLE